MKKPLKKTGCGDWYRTWGLGTNKVGHLHIELVEHCPVNFVWKGHCQGRHGQVWNKRSKTRFILFEDKVKVIGEIYPSHEDVVNAMNILLSQNGLPEVESNIKFVE